MLTVLGDKFYWDGRLMDTNNPEDVDLLYHFISAANDAFLAMSIYCVKAEVEDDSRDKLNSPRYNLYKKLLTDAGIW